MTTALLITRSDDNPCVDVVAKLLRGRGVRAVRLDTDRFPHDIRLSTRFAGDATQRRWRVGDDVVDGNDVAAVWYRRFLAGGSLPASLGDLRQPAVDESRRTLYGLVAALDVPHMDRLEDVRRCDHKELQLQRARALGLTIADTLFSNDPLEVRAFVDGLRARGQQVITKMQSSFAVLRDGLEHVVFTSVVDDRALADLDGLRFCPMQFQELVEKRIELRATVVGDDVFCAAVDSQGHSKETRIDWRKDGAGLLHKWTPHTLPSSTERQLIALVRSFGLSYAAADFIVADDGRLVFLEINAGGEWFWLDEHFAGSPRLPIAAAIAGWLQRS